jgi:hypothetical protein
LGLRCRKVYKRTFENIKEDKSNREKKKRRRDVERDKDLK